MTCSKCGEPIKAFYVSRSIPLYDGFGRADVGIASCSNCGHDEVRAEEVLYIPNGDKSKTEDER